MGMRSLIGSLVLATTLFAAGCGGAQTDAPKTEQGAVPAALTVLSEPCRISAWSPPSSPIAMWAMRAPELAVASRRFS
jgi:ABC-type phosphate/phosphonate transport system substrate-binding protein